MAWSPWQRKKDLFRERDYRMKDRDTQAVVLNRRNSKTIAIVVNGTLIEAEECVMVRFEGLYGTEMLVEGEVLVRTVMPGAEYFSAMNPDEFKALYDKVESHPNNKHFPESRRNRNVGKPEDAEVRQEAVLGGGGAGDAGEPDAGAGVVRRRAVPRFGEAGAVRQGRGAASYL